jgi:hypothetical protein
MYIDRTETLNMNFLTMKYYQTEQQRLNGPKSKVLEPQVDIAIHIGFMRSMGVKVIPEI